MSVNQNKPHIDNLTVVFMSTCDVFEVQLKSSLMFVIG